MDFTNINSAIQIKLIGPDPNVMWLTDLNPDDQVRIRGKVYNILLAAVDCGPFDGGCLVVAKALQLTFGGEVVVLVNADDQANHAALLVDGQLLDFDGPATPDAFLSRFNRQESALKPMVAFRPIKTGDLPEAPDKATVIALIAEVFREKLTTAS